jgi:hypothetical protein
LANYRCRTRSITDQVLRLGRSRCVESRTEQIPDAVESGMTYITGGDRSQLLLLPEAVDDYVGSDNPVRFIDTFIDGLDLASAARRLISRRIEPVTRRTWPVIQTRNLCG